MTRSEEFGKGASEHYYHASQWEIEPGEALEPRGMVDPSVRSRERSGWDTSHVYMAPDEKSGMEWAKEIHSTHEEPTTHLYAVRAQGKVKHSVADIGLPQVSAKRAVVVKRVGGVEGYGD